MKFHTPAYIADQRLKGWPDMHPEDNCHRCGAVNFTWFADRQPWLDATAEWSRETGLEGICCPACFSEMHEAQTGLKTIWHLVAWCRSPEQIYNSFCWLWPSLAEELRARSTPSDAGGK